MTKLLKYVLKHKRAVLGIFCLLIIQAYCDLALPQYTSDIVDVGIQQGGIADAAIPQIREETFKGMLLFMTDEEQQLVTSFYYEDRGSYYRNSLNQEEIDKLNTVMALPLVIYSGAKETISADALADMTPEAQAAVRAEVEASMDGFSEAVVFQRALLAVSEEYQAQGIDTGKVQRNYLLRKGGMMLAVTVVMVIAAILAGLLSSRTGALIGMELREKVFNKVVSFSNGEMNQFSTASLITRSTNDIQQVQMVSVMMLRMVIYSPILGIGGIIKVANTRTGMGWVIGLAVALVGILVGILVIIAMPKFKLMQTLVDRLNLVSREILTGIPVIRAFGREKYEEKRFEKANRDLMSTQLFTNRVMTFMMPVMMLIMNCITVLIVWNGAHGIDMGRLQVGDMIAFITYTMQIVMSFLFLTMISVMLPRAGVAAARIDEVLNTEPSIVDKDIVRDGELAECQGYVAFEDVSFTYPGAAENAVENITFIAEPGKTTAIIGSTGCGKSTLLHLITRFYEVTAGRITVDGIDIRDISQEKLRSLIGFVPQKGVLFSGDIESNIKFDGELVTDEAMKEAAAIAQATDFIEEKSEGYQTPIAQGGTNVSGGQKQRLSIARAIAKNPKIFLFDDSFSALDYKTDVALRRALNEKVGDSTVVIVAQRISTILHADQIIVMDEGRIAGMGTHRELLKSCQAYQEIAKSQLSDKELEGGPKHE